MNTQLYSYADYLKWNDGKRYELLYGKRYELMSAPTSQHGDISFNIAFLLKLYSREQKTKCRIFHAPFDVRLTKPNTESTENKDIYTVVQPDICVICDANKIDKRGCLGSPDLIVEVLSPSTMKYDLNEKFNLYEKNGVREYWVVNPEAKTLIIFHLTDENKYDEGEIFAFDEEKIVKTKLFEGLTIDLTEIFENY